MALKDNNFKHARKIGVLGDDVKVIRDAVGPGDNVDFISFRTTEQVNLRSVLRGLKDNADLALFDKNRNPIAFSRNPGTQSELIETILDKGRYFLKVVRRGGQTPYRLRLSARKVAAPDPTTAEFVGLTDGNTLAFFNDESLSKVTQRSITGLQSGESLVAIDFRPNTGQLFGVSSGSRLYTIDVTTGAATQVGTAPFAVLLDGTSFGIDFNPTVDRIRLVSDTGQNLRINPNTGAIVDADTVTGGLQVDGTLNGATDSIMATDYTNNVSGATTTVLYGIDTDTDQLFIQDPPNAGTQTLVGALGVDFGPNVGFDIVTQNGVNMGIATSGSSLYSIDLTTGAATLIGKVKDQQKSLNLTGLAARSSVVKPDPATAKFAGLTPESDLVFFNSNGSNFNGLNNVTKVDITGLQTGESLVGIDFRPNDGQLYGVGSTNRLYSINVSTGVATQVGSPFAVSLSGTSFGVDFNPTVDRLRIVSDAGQNLRINPDTGAVVDADTLTGGIQIDGNLNGATDSIVATAYANNVAGATTTTQYGIDADTDQLFIQNPPNAGTQTLVGSLGVDIAPGAGFDIVSVNGVDMGYVSSGSSLYSVNLATGAATLLGNVQDINQPIGLAGLAARA
jgi:3D (Asp-Asp-Asp) domain-containing protein